MIITIVTAVQRVERFFACGTREAQLMVGLVRSGDLLGRVHRLRAASALVCRAEDHRFSGLAAAAAERYRVLVRKRLGGTVGLRAECG